MCGVPIERADDYLNRLIALGHRVAVCEQLEDPAEAKRRGAKSVVKRDVVRLVTPGTITEERLLEPGRARLLVAVQRLRASDGRSSYGLAALDLSTGAFALSEADETGLGRRNRAARALRDRRFAGGVRRAGVRAPRRRPRRSRDSARARGGRRVGGRAAGVRILRRRDPRRLRRLLARRDRGGGAGAGLRQAHAVRGASGPVAADPTGARREPRDRPGDARQPRAHAHARRRARGIAARDHRPHRHARRRAPHGRAPREPADRPGRDRRTARRARVSDRGRRRRGTRCAASLPARPTSCARCRA